MSSPSERYAIDLATPDDGAALAAIYRSDDGFPGDLQVLFTRGDDAYASLLADGEGVVIPIVRERATGRIVGMGACVTRRAWVEGQPTKVGYLTGLKALPEFRRRVPLIPQVYAFLREQTPDVELYYTTILSENTLARRMLERRRPTMPEYRHVGTYTTHFFRHPWPTPPASAGTLDELMALQSRADLASVSPTGLTDADVRLVRDRDGTPLAGCAITVPRHKGYTVTHYGGSLATLARIPVHWAGYPRLPQVGVRAKHGAIGLLAGTPDAQRRLVRAVAREFAGLDFLLYGSLDATPDPLRGVRTIPYSSELYTVHFDGCLLSLDPAQVTLDVARL